VSWCWRDGMCVVLGQTPCSETPRPTGRSRLGTAEVDTSPRRARRQSSMPRSPSAFKAPAPGDRSTPQASDATTSRAEGRAQRASPGSAPTTEPR